MYKDYGTDPQRFWSTTPILKFIKAHLPLQRDQYRLYRHKIITYCVRIYWSRLLDLWLQDLQTEIQWRSTDASHSLLSDEEKDDMVNTCCFEWSASSSLDYDKDWERYMREAYPMLAKRMTDRALLKTQVVGSGITEVVRSASLMSEGTNKLAMEFSSTDPMTFNGYGRAFVDVEQLKGLSGLISSASVELQIMSRSIPLATLEAISRIKYVCRDLIRWHHDKKADLEYDDISLLSTGVVLLGPMPVIRFLDDSESPIFNFSDETYESSYDALHENDNTLHLRSKYVATVGDCSGRLITWVDSASRRFTVSQWAVCALRSRSHDFALRFAATLVGGLYEESPGSFRQLRRPEENGLLWNWFESSILPRLCEVNTAVSNQQLTWLMDGRAEDHVDLDINKSFDAEMRLATEGRVFFTTEDHGMGLGPGSMMPGDEVHLLPGGNRPFVLRPRAKTRGSSTDEYELIGDCFYLTDDRESQESEHNLLKGYLPLEVLGRFLDRGDGSRSIILR